MVNVFGGKKDSVEVLEFYIGRGQGSDKKGGLEELVLLCIIWKGRK